MGQYQKGNEEKQELTDQRCNDDYVFVDFFPYRCAYNYIKAAVDVLLS